MLNRLLDRTRMASSHPALRLVSYLTIWVAYLAFMASHAPRGIGWLSWHLRRTYNAVEYLKINGYLSSYGFSIWSNCQDCGSPESFWDEKIYLSSNALKLAPYIFLNHFWGIDALQKYGPMIDRVVIFIAAAAAAELVIRCVRSYSPVAPYVVGVACLALFATAPWTYKMLLAGWVEVYFLMFFLLGLLFFAIERNRMACVMLFMAGVFHYQWAVAVAVFYCLLFVISRIVKADQGSQLYVPPYGRGGSGRMAIVLSLMIPPLVELSLRLLAQQTLTLTKGASLLTRIGISGNFTDTHNGGLLGALQFLGGNKVTHCLARVDSISGGLADGMTRYYCILSVTGMAALSLAAVAGLIILLKQSTPAKWIVFPLAYALLLFVTLLQQSLSVHLMGYSYIFSFLFAAGIVGLMVYFSKFIRSSALSIALSIPCVVGIVLLSMRVSMLTDAYG